MLSQSYYYNSSNSESDSSDTIHSSHRNQLEKHCWDHSYDAEYHSIGSLYTNSSLKTAKVSVRRMEANMEEMALYPDLLNYDSNDYDANLANAPTPYLADIEGMHDFNDINDSDLVPFESTNDGFINNVDYDYDNVVNEITVDNNNNRDFAMNDSISTKVMSDSSDFIKEQMQSTVTNTHFTRRKRLMRCDDSEEEDDDTDDEQDETIPTKTRRKGKKYVRQQNGGQKASKTNQCMSRNAIAARENREKKKEHIKTLEKQVESLTKSNQIMSVNMSSLTQRNGDLELEVEYYKNIVANVPQIASLIDHMRSAPNVEFIGTSLSSGVDVLANTLKNPMHSSPIDGNAVRKSHRIAAKAESSGICFHINNKKMSLEFCSKCSDNSNKLFKIKKEK